MCHPYRREAQFLVEEGADPEAVDKAMTEFGMAMGPLQVGDLAGLDVGWRIRQEHRHLEQPGIRKPRIEDVLCERGRFGQKTRAGWYRYDDQRRPHRDTDVDALIAATRGELDITPRTIDAAEITDRLLYALVNEAARILEEGIALRSVDIDIVYINGYGYPAWRGGPMFSADSVGLPHVLERIRQFEQQHGALWSPAPLLERLVSEGKSFGAWDKREVA
jgi:3-hydroxyacyl-CoA dehydrogenase